MVLQPLKLTVEVSQLPQELQEHHFPSLQDLKVQDLQDLQDPQDPQWVLNQETQEHLILLDQGPQDHQFLLNPPEHQDPLSLQEDLLELPPFQEQFGHQETLNLQEIQDPQPLQPQQQAQAQGLRYLAQHRQVNPHQTTKEAPPQCH